MIQEPVVILANGNYPTHLIPLQKIEMAASIICCDGSVNQLIDNGLEPYAIIGDLDSIDLTLKSKYNKRIIHVPDQDENDLQKAIRWADNEGILESTILGATGKRDDHSLSNIFILLQLPTLIKCTILTDYGKFTMVEETTELNSFIGQKVSIFSADPEIKITSTNLKYNLISSSLNNLYCGSLNESINEVFTLAVTHGKILVYQVFA